MPYELLIAIRHLRAGGLQTALIVGGATIGVAIFIAVSCLVNGSTAELMNNIIGSIPHIVVKEKEREPRALKDIMAHKDNMLLSTDKEKVVRRKSKLSSWLLLKQQLLNIDSNIVAVSPKATGQCFMSRGEKTMSVLVEGIIPSLQDEVVNVSGKIIKGDFLSLTNDQIVIGKRLADELGIKLRDKVHVLSSEGIGKTYIVSGIFNFGVESMDSGVAFTSMENAQHLYKLDNFVTELEIRIRDLYSADRISRQIETATGYSSESWMFTNRGILKALEAQNNTCAAIQYFTMLIAAFGIASVLVMAVVEKSRDIGILKAMGATTKSIVKIFLFEGIMVGLLGAIVGAVLGIIIGILMSRISTVVEFEGYSFNTFPVIFKISDILIAMGVAFLTGLLAGIFPAYRAARLDPVEVIRYG